MTTFGIIGAGWRSEFYVRIAAALPERFRLCGMYIRRPEKAREFSARYAVPVFESLEALLDTAPDFIVSCVNRSAILDEIERLCQRGVSVLSETPAGASLQQIEAFRRRLHPAWRVQVAEQFRFQPRNAAIRAVIDSGLLGRVHQAQVCCCHDYHAVSLIRFFLGIGNRMPDIQSVSLCDPIVRYHGRNGATEPTEVTATQKIAVLRYGEQTAIYNFSSEQYFSDLRSTLITVRGTKGEIVNDTVTYLDGNTPMRFSLTRNAAGSNESLNGMYLDSITGNGRVWYRNPFVPARLTDEEIAVAAALAAMEETLRTGRDFYPLTSAMLDAETALHF